MVSTEDERIARVAQDFGAEVPFMRPKHLAQDNSPEWEAWQHAVKTLNEQDKSRGLDVFVAIPTTSPLRITEDVDRAIQAFLEGESDVIITVKNTARHPSFNMVALDEKNYANLVLPQAKTISRRQDAPVVYDMTTVVYVAKPDFIVEAGSLFEGKVKAVLIPEERALDIDTELDFQFAEFLINRGQRKNT